MEPLPLVTQAEYRGEYKIHLTFTDGTQGTADFEDWLDGPVFEPLRDQEVFQSFVIEAGSISWPNGADIAPETLHEKAKSSAAA